MDASRATILDPVYAAPHTESPAAGVARAATLRTRAAKLLGVAMMGFILSIGVIVLFNSGTPGAFVFLASAAVAMVGAGHAIAAFFKGLGVAAGGGAAAAAVGLTLVNVAMSLMGGAAAFVSTMTFTRGRQIRSFGKILLPPVSAGGAWTTTATSMGGLDFDIDVDDMKTRRALASQWRENGRTEHASVAAFARLTLDLMALGAPPQLVADANRDALDEIRHAQLCFGLARALDGRVESPGAFPAASSARTLSSTRTLALAQLAVDSLIDGALHEGVSARIIAKLARRCAVPAIQEMLREIAADEGRHARHGWDVVLWCLAEGGEPVAHALEGALRALPRVMASPMDEEARAGGWERFGIMGECLEAEEHEAARAYVERRSGQAIAASRALRQSALG